MQFNFKRFLSKEKKKKTIIFIGLGNPGEKYKYNYHNIGYMVIDLLASKFGIKIRRAECSALVGNFSSSNKKIILAKPITYMNLSGQAVKSLAVEHGVDIKDIIIIYDDIDLARFDIRARSGGSAGTHKGMGNIIDILGDTQIKRIRIGIGKEGRELKDYVLSDIKKQDRNDFQSSFEKVTDALIKYVKEEDFEKLMNGLNRKVGDDI